MSQSRSHKLDNHADIEKAHSQTKKNWGLYEGTACRRRDLGAPFQFSCHLSTPTHHIQRAHWGSDGEKKWLPLTHPPTVRKFLRAITQRGGGAVTLLLCQCSPERHQRAAWLGTVVLCRCVGGGQHHSAIKTSSCHCTLQAIDTCSRHAI